MGLIWNLQLPLSQKISIGGLFCLGWICIAVAIIRVKELGSTITQSSAPSTSWLALWGTVEGAIAVIIGCCPGLYRSAKQKIATYKASYNQYGGSHGYARHTGDASGNHSDSRAQNTPGVGIGGDVRLSYLPSKAARERRGGRNFYSDDATSSQEELAGKGGFEIGKGWDGIGEIRVTKSVTVRNDAERDVERVAECVCDKDIEIGVAKWRH